MSRAILTMGKSTQLVAPILNGSKELGIDLFFSFGESIPDLCAYDDVSYWMAGAYALKLQQAGLAKGLSSPGAEWLPQLPIVLLGRSIQSGTLNDLRNVDGKVWVKPSEAKVIDLPAGLYSADEVEAIFAANGFTDGIHLQWTHDVLNLDFEHRFFVADSQVVTGSPYKVAGKGFGPDIDFSQMEAASEFAQHTLDALRENAPAAFTLDVAWDMDSKEWLVVEGNRAWSSGFYGADAGAALDVVRYSCNNTNPLWAWKPDEHLMQLSREYTPLRITSTQMEDYGWVKSST